MYMRPGNPWDLKGCRQKQGESVWDYIQHFSQKCHELPKICDADVISVFWSGTTYWTLVHELGSEQPKTMKELLDIATRHAASKETVWVVFVQGGSKAVPSGGQRTSTIATNKGTKRGIKSDKRGTRWWLQRVVVATSCDEEMNDKNTGDFNEELMAATERDFKCPNHTIPVKNKLKACSMMNNYMATGTLARAKKLEGDSAGKVAAPFPEEKLVMSIYGGPAPHESCRKLKLIGQVINSVSTAAHEYLHWSESSTTFTGRTTWIACPSQEDFPSSLTL
jgi:hypothetical protein